MAKKKLEMPSFLTPMDDLIPNEVLYDGFRLNVWIGTFMAAYGMITAAEEGVDKSKTTKSHGISLFTVAKIASPALAVGDYLFGGGDDAEGAGVGIVVDWKTKLATAQARQPPNQLEIAALTIMADDFTRRALLASSIASAVTWSMFETKVIENLPNLAPESVSLV
jgi:hypothetical protein